MWTLLLLACDPRDAVDVVQSALPHDVAPPAVPADLPSADLGPGTGAPPWRALDHLDAAAFTLPAGGGVPATAGRFTLAEGWTSGGRGARALWVHDLPFYTDMPRPNYAPMGARLVRGDAEVPFAAGSVENATPDADGWIVDHGRIELRADTDPGTWDPPPVLVVDELAATLRRRDPVASGLPPATYARAVYTHERLTRPAVLLPAGGQVEFTVSIPAGARLGLAVGQLDDPLTGQPGGDGATARVTMDGETVWSATARGAADDAVRVDLGRYAGRTVRLGLAVEARGSPDGDHAVFVDPRITAPAPAAPRRIVVVGIDTLRYDALSVHGYGRPTSPEADAWARQSTVFSHAYAPAPRTRPSFRTAITGQYPLEAIHAPTVAELLRPQGWATAGFAANVHLVPRFGFADGFDWWEYENGARADVEVDRALAWLGEHRDEDSFVFLHLMDPHTYYNAPEPFGSRFQLGSRPRDVPELFNRWQVIQLMRRQRLTAAAKAWIRAAYDGEVAYTSFQLARFLAAVEALPGRTLTVVHSDHGEEFWDHNGFEHNHSLFDELVHTVLWMRAPGGRGDAGTVATQVGLVDIVPTVLDFAGVAPERWPRGRGRSLRPYVDPARSGDRAALDAALQERPLELGHLMFDKERWGVTWQGWKYILHTWSGREELYDRGTDRAELKNRSGDADAEARLAEGRRRLAEATGWPVRRGYRVRIVSGATPVLFTFDAPVADAGIFDPEANQATRANLEWGERPRKTVRDVGELQLAADRTSFRFTPGPGAVGAQLYVTCDAECPTGTLQSGSYTQPIAPRGGAPLAAGTRYAFEPGWIVVPTITEAEVLATPDAGQLEQLQALGYVGGGEAD